MNISRKLRMTIVAIIGAIYILFGLSQAVFKYEVDRKFLNNASLVLMVVAAFLFFSGRKKKEEEPRTEENETEEK